MRSALAPPRLVPGDRVAVVAPAGPVPPEAFAAGIARLRQRYRVDYDEAVLSRTGFLAGSDDRRAAELLRWLGEPDVKALFCARGGYGVLRILPALDRAARALLQRPLPLVGFSDATALLAWAVGAGVRAVHGPVISQLERLGDGDLAALWALLEDPSPAPPWTGLVPLSRGAGDGRAEGPLLGGNLEVLSRLVGTRWQPDWRGAVVLLEEVGERPYRIDRTLTQLELAGRFAGAVGLVIGDLVRCEEPPGAWPGQPSPTALEVVAERLSGLGVPVLAGAPLGHADRNRPLAIGARVAIDGQAGTLTPLEGAVV
jgi:muramoyltetrapeptide carboxypeptidase